MINRTQPEAAPTQPELDLLDRLFPEKGRAKASPALGSTENPLWNLPVQPVVVDDQNLAALHVGTSGRVHSGGTGSFLHSGRDPAVFFNSSNWGRMTCW